MTREYLKNTESSLQAAMKVVDNMDPLEDGLRDIVNGIKPVHPPAPRPEPDLINNPPHYKSHPSGVECIVIVEHMSFNCGNAIKYIWRAGQKHGNLVDDLKKARWYIDREIQRLGT